MNLIVHHPAFQSIVVPIVLGALAVAVLRRAVAARHAAWGGYLGLLGALAFLPGFDTAPASGAQKLPWVMLLGLVLAAIDLVRMPGRQRAVGWAVALLAWALAAAWLAAGRVGLPTLLVWVGFGAIVLIALLALATVRAGAPDLLQAPGKEAASGKVELLLALLLASLGLAALAGRGGSLLLAQLALMLASAVVVIWGSARRGASTAPTLGLSLALGLAWLSLAWLWVLAAPSSAAFSSGPPYAATEAVFGFPGTARAARVGLLALPMAVVWLVSRRTGGLVGRSMRWWVPMLAALPVVLAVLWPETVNAPAGTEGQNDPDDPYLESAER